VRIPFLSDFVAYARFLVAIPRLILADLGNAYEVLDRMRPVPFDPADALILVLAALIPLVPLLLTVMPLGQLLELAGKVLM
jgi:hypothetical protein